MAAGKLSTVEESDEIARLRDALHILPLSTMPIEHPFLKRALMVKDAKLDSVIEFYKDQGGAGSGQKDVDGVAREKRVIRVHRRVNLLALHHAEHQGNDLVPVFFGK